MDQEKKRRRLTISLGPLGLSLLAAGITAVALAAVSLADSGGNGSADNGQRTQSFSFPGPGGGVGAVTIAGPNLSDADRQKMEDFRQCMQDNGAPAPPAPGDIDPSKGPPKPLSSADRDKLQKAWEACKDKLPEAMQKAGPPQFRVGGCAPAPPPGAPGAERGKQQNQDQSDSSGTSSGGTSA
jgi:hypothetical protein